MTSDDQDILAKISKLAGQINRHKNGQGSEHQTQPIPLARSNSYSHLPQTSTGWRPSRGGHSSRGYRGGRPGAAHRNRTLVLNSNSPTPPASDAAEVASNEAPENSRSTSNTPSWVTKKDRHLQLINTSIFEKESQNRAKAMEQTRKQKTIERDTREKAKLARHLQRLSTNIDTSGAPQSRPVTGAGNYEINVQGIQFRVAKNGSKLIKIPGEKPSELTAYDQSKLHPSELGLLRPGDLNAAKSTPKAALVGGVRFHRSKNGNMYRAGIIKAHRYGHPTTIMALEPSFHHSNTNSSDTRRNAGIKKINEPCKMFTTTGSCPKGPRCRYIHDPSKVAVCKEFLLQGSCPSGESCDLSHELTPERTPTCLHFTKGTCAKADCRYTHVRVSPNALVCRPFAVYGYCEKGTGCEERHVYECPDFSNTGKCTTKGCKLPHKHKASIMRSNTNRGDVSAEDESSDLSSDDEDEEIDSDDVDSDDLDEEYFGHEDDAPDVDYMRRDYVQLS